MAADLPLFVCRSTCPELPKKCGKEYCIRKERLDAREERRVIQQFGKWVLLVGW